MERRKRERSGWGRDIWNREGCEIFRSKLDLKGIVGENIRDEWKEVEGRIKEAIRGTEKSVKKEEKRVGWGVRENERKSKEGIEEMKEG